MGAVRLCQGFKCDLTLNCLFCILFAYYFGTYSFIFNVLCYLVLDMDKKPECLRTFTGIELNEKFT